VCARRLVETKSRKYLPPGGTTRCSCARYSIISHGVLFSSAGLPLQTIGLYYNVAVKRFRLYRTRRRKNPPKNFIWLTIVCHVMYDYTVRRSELVRTPHTRIYVYIYYDNYGRAWNSRDEMLSRSPSSSVLFKRKTDTKRDWKNETEPFYFSARHAYRSPPEHWYGRYRVRNRETCVTPSSRAPAGPPAVCNAHYGVQMGDSRLRIDLLDQFEPKRKDRQLQTSREVRQFNVVLAATIILNILSTTSFYK